MPCIHVIAPGLFNPFHKSVSSESDILNYIGCTDLLTTWRRLSYIKIFIGLSEKDT